MKLAASTALSLLVTLAVVSLASAAGIFGETFDGVPSAPLVYSNPNSWDILPSGFDRRQVGTAAQVGHHGPACERPGFPYTAANTHPLLSVQDMVYICNNHVMTATGLAGYAAIYMIPPAVADFSGGTASIRFEMSTLRTAARDWVYFTIMPFDGHNKFSYNNSDQAIAPNNVNIKLAGTNVFLATQRVNGGGDVAIGGDGFTTWDMVQGANGFTEDAARRDNFQIDISANHLRVCLTGNSAGATYSYQGRSPFCWVDSNLPTSLSPSIWNNQAVFMITHVSYNAEKSCSADEDQFSIVHNATGDTQCPPDSWHWDNVNISPAIPFTIINPTQRYAEFNDVNGANTVTFPAPAPANAHLSYVAAGDCNAQRFSVDGGAHWIAAIPQPATTQCQHPENGGEYWTPIPQGATSVKITGVGPFGGGQYWGVEGISIWAPGSGVILPASTPAPAPTPAPTAPPVPTASPAPTHTAAPTATPTAAPTATGAPTATPAPTAPPVGGNTTPAPSQSQAPAATPAPTAAPTQAPLFVLPPFLAPIFGPSTPASPAPAPAATAASAVTSGAPAASQVVAQQQPKAAASPVAVTQPANLSAADFHSSWVDQSSNPTADAGSTTTLTVRFRNTGTATWVKGVAGQQANLGLNGDGTALASGWPSADRVAIQNEAAVAPGGVGSFTFNVQAPERAGSYQIAVRPVIDGVKWMEDEGVYFVVTSRAVANPVLTFALRLLANPMLITGLITFLVLLLMTLAARKLVRRRLAHA